MVARRLLILMLVMLVIASLSSVFLADPGSRRGPNRAPTTTRAPERSGEPESAREGRLLKATLDASAPGPKTLRLRTGDQLALRVEARRPVQVELGGLGQLEDVFPPAPARFDLYADRPGRFPVRVLPAKRKIGTIVVTRRGTKGNDGRP
jgi:hypothetical protein